MPLSPPQSRLWTVNYLGGGSPDYVSALLFAFEGPLDTEALRTALTDLTTRHEILRTVLPYGESGPEQRILPADTAPLDFRTTVLDEEADLDAELDAAVSAELATPFDLQRDLPLRARLYLHDEKRHTLLLAIHHVAFDGHSAAPLHRDLAVAYTARAAGQAPAWPAPAPQYADHTLALHHPGADRDRPDSPAARYWTRELTGLPTPLPLPRTNHPSHPAPPGAAATIPLTIDPRLHTALEAAARQCSATTYMAVHAAFAAALTAAGAGHDIPVGVPLSGRDTPGLDNLVGCLVNTVVLRTRTSGDPTPRALITQVRDRLLAAHEHRSLPFDHLVGLLNPPRSAAHHPLFQVALTYLHHPTGADAPHWPEPLAVRLAPVHRPHTELDLLLELHEQRTPDNEPAGITGQLTYAAGRFTHETAAFLHARLTTALTAVPHLDAPFPLPQDVRPAE
ncbi:condensation domain-containing protein [Streptomyces albofaciens]|uniref:condensation domain-containing protein n=1 Tax=Streptomyces albofaciens TaxID=66866 RepID=UPI001FCC9A90|nr:condensation domain-containing protein [Streptomyces albofaciens]